MSGGKSKVLRGHEAARGVLFVFEQFLDVLGLFLFHEVDEFLRLGLGQVAEHVSRLVRRHAFQDVGRPLLGHVVDDIGLDLRFQFVQGLGRGVHVEAAEDGRPLLLGDLADDLGKVGRMQARHLLARKRSGSDASASARWSGHSARR